MDGVSQPVVRLIRVIICSPPEVSPHAKHAKDEGRKQPTRKISNKRTSSLSSCRRRAKRGGGPGELILSGHCAGKSSGGSAKGRRECGLGPVCGRKSIRSVYNPAGAAAGSCRASPKKLPPALAYTLPAIPPSLPPPGMLAGTRTRAQTNGSGGAGRGDIPSAFAFAREAVVGSARDRVATRAGQIAERGAGSGPQADACRQTDQSGQ